MRFWRNTSIAGLRPNTSATLPNGTLGYEWDEDLDNGFGRPGLIRMSDTVAPAERAHRSWLHLRGGHGQACAHPLPARERRAGVWRGHRAVVVGPRRHARSRRGAPSVPMQQATMNLFADMGVQPLTVQPGLARRWLRRTPSAPTSTITSPVHNAGVPANTFVTISGTATDGGGGAVGGVEVIRRWRRHLAAGRWPGDVDLLLADGTAAYGLDLQPSGRR